MLPHGDEVIVLRAFTEADRYGNDTPAGWQQVACYLGVAFDPGGSVEVTVDGRQGVVTTPRLLGLPTDANVTAADRVKVRGVTYEIVGDPAQWRNPFTGWSPGVAVNLKRVEG